MPTICSLTGEGACQRAKRKPLRAAVVQSPAPSPALGKQGFLLRVFTQVPFLFHPWIPGHWLHTVCAAELGAAHCRAVLCLPGIPSQRASRCSGSSRFALMKETKA